MTPIVLSTRELEDSIGSFNTTGFVDWGGLFELSWVFTTLTNNDVVLFQLSTIQRVAHNEFIV